MPVGNFLSRSQKPLVLDWMWQAINNIQSFCLHFCFVSILLSFGDTICRELWMLNEFLFVVVVDKGKMRDNSKLILGFSSRICVPRRRFYPLTNRFQTVEKICSIEVFDKWHRRLVKSLLWNIVYNFGSVVSFVVWYMGTR